MSFRTVVQLCLGILLVWSTGLAADKSAVRVERIGDISEQDIVLAPSLATADDCLVSGHDTIAYRIDGWVVGFELYKSLMNPSNQCTDPYPFTVSEVNLVMGFNKAARVTVAVDIEEVDSSFGADCLRPGNILAMSSDYTVDITTPAFYNIWIPLDTPIAVNGPFFAGFYIGQIVDSTVQIALLTDSIPVTCATYNIWDETVGWVDLCADSLGPGLPEGFPGRLAMEVSGTTGGNPSMEPDLQVVSPASGDVLYGKAELWAWDRALTGTVEYVMFEYSNGGPYVEIGRDFDGTSPIRNGVSPAVTGNGYSLTWDFSGLEEGAYTIRVTQVPTAGSSTSATISVYLEPTGPTAKITSPSGGSPFCLPTDIYMNSPDENLSFVEVYRRQATSLVTVGLTAVNQSTVGDVDSDPSDGNHAYDGEYGDYYSGPVAAAMAAMVWSSRGYPALTRQGATNLTVQQVAEGIAASLGTRSKIGTYDESMLAGLRSYAASKGGGFTFGYKRNPTYSDLRIWVEDEERLVLLGLGNSPGLWVTVDGFAAWQRLDSTYQVSVANPLTGTIQASSWRNRVGYSELIISGVWHRVETMISMYASAHNVSRTLIGADVYAGDGLAVHWTGTGIASGTYHYLRSSSQDNDGNEASHTILAEHNCTTAYLHGDYNGDRISDVIDLYRLRDFITSGGAAPTGGAARADCNCDNAVNIADIIFYLNYLYGAASEPCR